jgi:serine/threonine protein kinase
VSYLNRGAYGEAWRLDVAQGVRVAKILDGGAPSRLLREVSALEMVSSPHVVNLLDVQLVDVGGRQRVALMFEYIDGTDLEVRLRAGAWPSVNEITSFATALARGLAALHAAGGIHRDVKLGNIALRSGDFTDPVLLDLGLVRLVDMESITAYPAAVGTPPYMSPQIVAGERAEAADDMWSLGVVLYVLLARRHPFYGPPSEAADAEEAIALMRSGAKPLEETGSLDAIVSRLLAFERADRPSAAEVVDALSAS